MVYIYCCKHFVYVNWKTNNFITTIGVDLNVIRNGFENRSTLQWRKAVATRNAYQRAAADAQP
jgi:hypothetical protein